jgi:hypothetical protein
VSGARRDKKCNLALEVGSLNMVGVNKSMSST